MGTPLRDSVKEISPPWLANDSPATNGAPLGVGGRYMYTLGLMFDLLLEKMNQSMKARMPTLCDPSCLPFIGLDRVMPQGPGESNASYAVRLQRAFQTWQHAGSRGAVMGQVSVYLDAYAAYQTELAGQLPVITIVGDSGTGVTTWDTYYNTSDPTTEPPAHARIDSGNWNWDGAYQFWRAWLVMFWALSPIGLSGAVARVASLSDGFQTIAGLSSIPSTLDTTYYVTISGAATSGNNGTFQIVEWLSGSSVIIANPSGGSTDANNGSLVWSLANYPTVAPAPVIGAPGVTIGSNSNIAIGLQIEAPITNTVQASAYFTSLQPVVRLWKSASTFYPGFIHSFGGGDQTTGYEFSPNSSSGAGNPDGTWGTGLKVVAGETVASQVTNVPMGRFSVVCDGTAVYLNGSFQPTGA